MTPAATGIRHQGNHAFLVDTARRLGGEGARVLDFGCGLGGCVRLGLDAGLDMRGVDTYAGWFHNWREAVAANLLPRLHETDGTLPFPEASFDVVVSNQVFEHVADPRPALAEIARVLVPGGTFVALFPVRETWYEGHVGLYFAHRLVDRPGLLRTYLHAAHRLGFGLARDGRDAPVWAEDFTHALRHMCHFHAAGDVRAWWREAFGTEPASLASDFVAHRLRGSRLAEGVPAALREPLFRFVCHARAGIALSVRKSEA